MNKLFFLIFFLFVIIFISSLIVFTTQIIGSNSEDVTTLISGLLGVNNSDLTTLISGFLSLFGGAIGAFGAYLVARYQMEAEKKKTQQTIQFPVYVAFKIEFEKIVRYLENENNKSKVILLTHRYPNYLMDVFICNEDIWERKWFISDPVLLTKLIEFRDVLTRIDDSYNVNIDQLHNKMISSFNSNDYFINYKIWNTHRLKRKGIIDQIPENYLEAKQILELLEKKIVDIQRNNVKKNDYFLKFY